MPESAARTIERTIAYSPLPSQKRFHACGYKFKGYSGAVGSGKSLALVHEALKLCVINAGLDGLIGAPTYRMLEDVTKRAMFEVLETNGIPYTTNKSDNTITLTELHSTIFLRSMEEPTRLVGTNLAWFGIDEMSYCKKESFLRLQARLRHPRGKKLCGFGACTPNGFNWVYDYFIGERKASDFEMIRAIPGENKYLPSDYYPTLAQSYDERFYRQEVLGEYLALQSGTAYYAFDRTRNLDDSLVYDSACRLAWALDFNIDPMSSVIAQVRQSDKENGRQHKTVEVLDEISIRDGNVDLACQAFVDRTKRLIRTGSRLRVSIYGDAAGQARSHSGKSDWQMVREYMARYPEYELSWHIPSTNPAVKDRISAVNGAFYNAVGEIRARLHSRCKTLIKDCERVTWKRDSNGNMLGELDKKEPMLTHMSDAFGYLVAVEFPLANKVRISVF